jgi:putative Mg2+ transporter-C (MgtC) family protein
MSEADLSLLVRVAVGFVLAYIFGFERQLRGSPAGDRTFALVGASATAITAVAARTSPQAVAGVVTGIGFIGGGIVFQGSGGVVKVVTGAGLLLTLELRHIPGLRKLDAQNYRTRFVNDDMVRQTESPPESS